MLLTCNSRCTLEAVGCVSEGLARRRISKDGEGGDEIPLPAVALSLSSRRGRCNQLQLWRLKDGPRTSRPHRDSAALRVRYLSRLRRALPSKNKKKRAQASLAHPFVFVWRWGRDSNSWYPYEYGSLANCWFQPLTHPTGGLYTEVTCKSDCKDTVIFEKRAIFLSL